MPPRETRVVAAAISRDGRVLAARRGPEQSQALLWELPGGKVEPGESDQDALARELSEELGITVTTGTCLGETLHEYPEITVRLVAYACRLVEGEPEAREHAELRWLGPEELDLPWAPADLPLIPVVRATLTAWSQRSTPDTG